MNKKYYLAYGSNLNMDQMAWRCPTAVPVGISVLNDWQLLFKGSKTGYYLTVEPCKGAKVPVGVWEITQEDELRLDHYEGFPHFYYKKTLPVSVLNKDGRFDAEAMLYIMHEDRPVGVPSAYYVSICSKGYFDFGLNHNYLSDAICRALAEDGK